MVVTRADLDDDICIRISLLAPAADGLDVAVPKLWGVTQITATRSADSCEATEARLATDGIAAQRRQARSNGRVRAEAHTHAFSTWI